MLESLSGGTLSWGFYQPDGILVFFTRCFVPLPETLAQNPQNSQNSPATQFQEEPAHLSAPQGYGYLPARPGLTLDNGRYEVVRKLGWGQYSSTWLVTDSQQPPDTPCKYLAAKILTADATRRHKEGQMRELEFLQAVRGLQDRSYLPVLRGHCAEHSGPHGDHLVFFMDTLSTDVSRLRRSAPIKTLPLYMVKVVISELVDALKKLHNLKPDNVLFDAPSDNLTFASILAQSSPPVVHAEFDLNGDRYPIMRSQPIMHGFEWNTSPSMTELMTVTLADLGHGQWADREPTTQEISAYALRAPEVILGARFGTKADIWSFGCVTFELLTSRWLFHPQGGPEWSREEDHLARMMELTGETFSAKLLEWAIRGKDYFDDSGKLRRRDKLYPVSVEEAIANYKVLSETEIAPAAAFIRACIRLDPDERASAKELQGHDWLMGAFACCVQEH